MDDNPVKSLVEELGVQSSQKEHLDVILNDGKGEQFLIEASKFCEIGPVDLPRKIAFVDGGNGLLEESPNYTIMINRIYYSLFRGKERIKPKVNPRIEFLSCVTLDIKTIGKKKNTSYNTRLFPHSEGDKKYLPAESDLTSNIDSVLMFQDTKLNSLGRRFAEWQLAIHVVESELESGDMLVMDGSLQANFKNEAKYADRLYRLALSKGVIICGLSKTSRLVTESGEPLLARVGEIAKDVPFSKWYVKVAKRASSSDRGFILAAKFHSNSKFVFRFEILREQFERMTPDDINSILGSLVENSQDVAMLGYPYGAIDADRFAQVRLNELNMYKGFIMSEMLKKPEGERLRRYSASLRAHDVLNGVTS